MLRKNRLFTPGPTPLLPAAQTAMASFTAHHRTADFRALFQRVLSDMKEFVGTQNDVLVLACSGTGVMEASVSNLTSPGDKVLVKPGEPIRRGQLLYEVDYRDMAKLAAASKLLDESYTIGDAPPPAQSLVLEEIA